MQIKKMFLFLAIVVSFSLTFTSCNSNQSGNKANKTNQISTNDESAKNTSDIKQDNPADTDKQVSKDTSTNNSESKDDFSNIAAFWKDFRSTVINKDFNKIKERTRFPLKTRGPLDSDPVIEFNNDKFDEVFSLFLAQDSGVTGTNTVFNYIKNNERFNFKNRADYDKSGDYLNSVPVEGNHARIGDMEFEFQNNSWKLTFIYLDHDSYKKLGYDIGT